MNSVTVRRLAVNVLLDTHTALWGAEGDPGLSSLASAAVNDVANTAWFSVASAWELAIKVRAGRLGLDVAKLVDQLTRNGIRLLGIGVDDAIGAGWLDWAHKDPFDRMVVAQAQRLGFQIISRDEAIQLFLGTTVIVA